MLQIIFFLLNLLSAAIIVLTLINKIVAKVIQLIDNCYKLVRKFKK